MKKRILFVDDEPNVLQGLKRMLRPMRNEWDMVFAGGGEDALATMSSAEDPFDVVVSDMRMPGMDGAQLLTEVTRRYPNTVRIVLSGQSEKEAIFKAIGKTHQYLSKPCNPDVLKQTVARACALRDLLSNEGLKSLASQMDHMPSMPEIYMELVDELKEDSPSLQHISRLISQDVAMTAKILQLVNSAFFGIRRRITTVEMAVNYLGLENVSSLVLAANVFSQFQQSAKVKGFSMEALWSHSGQVGRYAQSIVKQEERSKEEVDDAMTAGLLHDCGKLIFASNMAREYEDALQLAEKEKLSLNEAEERVLGTNHAIMGAYLLGVWGLPDAIVEAVAFHHHPEKCPSSGCTALAAVHVANAVARSGKEKPKISLNYMSSCGLTDKTPDWISALLKQ
ncbi:MAG: HDOD domain-containing protein [Deltaproteobacteria bacterium]|nr:HDOD domain-containing protein [Deltaproteobacteria bacterium]MBN2672324.1 HDOD domain-containing protein [Deltaproteobacteria bacterium]